MHSSKIQARLLCHLHTVVHEDMVIWPLLRHNHVSGSGVYLSCGNRNAFPKDLNNTSSCAGQQKRQKQQTTNSRTADGWIYLEAWNVLPVQCDMLNAHSSVVTPVTCGTQKDVRTCLPAQPLAYPYMDIRMTSYIERMHLFSVTEANQLTEHEHLPKRRRRI